MSRYIDAEDLKERILIFRKYYRDVEHMDSIEFNKRYRATDVLMNILEMVKKHPTVDVVDVVHGEWFPIDVGDCCYRCSVCNFVRDAYLLEEDNYCPHCGAKMEVI